MAALMGGVLGGLLSSQQLEEYFIEVISVLNGNKQQARAIGHFRVRRKLNWGHFQIQTNR